MGLFLQALHTMYVHVAFTCDGAETHVLLPHYQIEGGLPARAHETEDCARNGQKATGKEGLLCRQTSRHTMEGMSVVISLD